MSVSRSTKPKVCKDCVTEGVRSQRPAPHPGPRCATHHRKALRASRARSHEARVRTTYGLPAGGYAAILGAQNGVCAGCGPRTGRNGTRGRRLAVDHRHADDAYGPAGEVRGLLCSTCNRAIGDFRDDPLTLLRLALYLINPPAREVLGGGA